ncbi:unnamed protein product [Nippostrongylus brasiliensis]|uniref:Ovule protein n=1 Tax=Nippostrongylus brasiliensis TaxID=27835 RepID=A0A0N4XVJ3_NIPBR|nr:unnamed protein product [Nippostrongylus brasiliensis]
MMMFVNVEIRRKILYSVGLRKTKPSDPRRHTSAVHAVESLEVDLLHANVSSDGQRGDVVRILTMMEMSQVMAVNVNL